MTNSDEGRSIFIRDIQESKLENGNGLYGHLARRHDNRWTHKMDIQSQKETRPTKEKVERLDQRLRRKNMATTGTETRAVEDW